MLAEPSPHPFKAIAPDFIDAAGARVAVRRAGSGAPVVCLHATGHGARDFDELAQRLGDRFLFIALDWPGQGDSPVEPAPASAARYAEVLAGAMDALGLKRAVILGNSIGGAAAITYAAAHPERVRALVLCNAGGLVRVNWLVRWFCKRLTARFARGAAGDPAFPRWFERYYRGVLPAPAAAARRAEIVADGAARARVLQQAWESFAQPEADLRGLTPKLTMPVLYAWARRDRALPWAMVKAAALKAPHARTAFFDAGHAAFLEQPDAFAAAFNAFIRDVPP